MSKAMTKAQLVDENIRLRAQCDVLEQRLHTLEEQHATRPVPGNGDLRSQYYAYVAKCRAHQAGRKVVGYKSFDQWARG